MKACIQVEHHKVAGMQQCNTDATRVWDTVFGTQASHRFLLLVHTSLTRLGI